MNKKHVSAWLAMARYTAFSVLTAFSAWLQQVGPDKWEKLTVYDWVTLAVALGLAALTAIGAVMNGRWTEAKNETEAKQ